MLITNCRPPTVLLVVGTVEGKVVNIHNEPIAGATVNITHIPATTTSSEIEEETISTISDFEGNFLQENIWDEFRINVQQSGFRGQSIRQEITSNSIRQVIDFVLIGSPERIEIILSKTVLSNSDTTDLNIIVTVEDEFNEESSGYNGNIMLTNENGVLQAVVPLDVKAEGISSATLEVNLSPDEIISGIYSLSASISDPDGNQIVATSDQLLTIN